ncbi:Cytochrome P450 2A6 [Cricetulus griseus]|uniref:Cytochrome P450 2A6 n=1 Tax=Cricetulus griseus TaxID=10029 RepID=G3HNS1_CRIGR|nr:Cytochrome P450 2A6 [Cricetulus griseus]
MLASGLLLVTVLAFLVVMVLMSVWKQRKLSGKMPPGPTPLPFIGNYLQLNTEQMYNSLMKIRERYGPVFTVHLGPRPVVVLCGQEAVKEALVDQAEEFSGRGEQATFDWLFKGYGVAFSSGERAKQLRRFSIATLRDFGVGKRGIEERIQEEAGFLLDAFRKTNVMKHLPGPQQQAFKELQGLEDFITKKVEQNQSTLDPNSPRDFIDSFLIRMQEEKKNPNTEFYMKNLVLTTLNLFFAGTETVSTPLRYGFLLLMKHPDVEALRFCTTIPRGTEVFPMLGSVLRDPKFFSNPKDFNPKHFLDDKGQFKKNDAFVPFSVGAPIDPTVYLSQTVSNVINSIVFGDRFDYEDKEFLELLRMMGQINRFAASPTGQLYDMFHSVMKYLPGPQQQIIKNTKELEDFMVRKVKQNQSTLDLNSPRNFIDSFLIHMQEEKKNPDSEFNIQNLVMTSLNLFFAGSETVSSTMRYGFLLLMKYPEVEGEAGSGAGKGEPQMLQPLF